MSYDYEKLYAEQRDALGAQTPVIAEFIAGLALGPSRVLDVGCGQGRDALPLARAGHTVTGVDLSPSGVADMLAVARAEGLPVAGHVADITAYEPQGWFDVVLIDRTLHMLDPDPRHATFVTLINAVSPGGWLVLADETANLPAFRAALTADGAKWTVERCGKGYLFAQRSGRQAEMPLGRAHNL